jgi:hypothetical protein
VRVWVREMYDLVVRVIGEGEAVVEEEAGIALLAVGIEDLRAGGDVPETLDDEAWVGGGVPVEWEWYLGSGRSSTSWSAWASGG